MKLKEKLAEEAAENCGEYSHLCEKWFLKGFEIARMMAANIIYDSLLSPSDLERQVRGMGQEEVK